jgi:hypothetical protein
MPINQYKKALILSILYFIILLPTCAAHSIGIKLGVSSFSFNYTDRNMDPYLEYDIDLRPYLGYDIEWVQLGEQNPLFAPYFGFYYDKQITKRLFFRPEISLIQKGVNFNQYDYERIIYQVKIYYLELPLSIGFQFFQKNKFLSEIYLGGSSAIKLHGFKRVGYHNSKVKNTELNNISNFDFSLIFGIDIKWKLFKSFFLFDMRGFIGIHDIFNPIKNQPQLYYQTQKTKNTGLIISLGYEFNN